MNSEKAYPARNVVEKLTNEYLSKCLGIQRQTTCDGFYYYFEPNSNDWLNRGNHNYKRLTRILECLDIFYLNEMREKLADFLIFDLAATYPNRIDTIAVVFWASQAYNRELVL
jgi:hypothetical protein